MGALAGPSTATGSWLPAELIGTICQVRATALECRESLDRIGGVQPPCARRTDVSASSIKGGSFMEQRGLDRAPHWPGVFELGFPGVSASQPGR